MSARCNAWRGWATQALATSMLVGCGGSSPLYDGDGWGTGDRSATGGRASGSGGESTAGSGGASGGAVSGASGGSGGSVGSGGYRGSTGGRAPGLTGGAAADTCPAVTVSGEPPHVLYESTERKESRFTPSCGALTGSGDVTFAWQAPYSGRFIFDTEGSSFDTVLAVQNGFCVAEELACNDDVGGSSRMSSVTLDLEESQWITLVVDGYSGSEGSVEVHISESSRCPDAELGSTVPVSQTGATVNVLDRFTPDCGSSRGTGDYVATFTAPRSGGFVFDTEGSSFDTVLAVYDGVCGGPKLGCNDDMSGTNSQVTLQLREGQTVTVVVDGYMGAEGRLGLNVEGVSLGACCEPHPDSAACQPPSISECVCQSIPDCCLRGWSEECVAAIEALDCGRCWDCPDLVMSGELPMSATATTVDQPYRRTSSCADGPDAGDYAVGFTAPYTGTFAFDTFGSEFDTVLSLLAGNCEGAELACNDDAWGLASEVTWPLDRGETVTVMISGFGGDSGPFTLNIRDAGPVRDDCCAPHPETPGCRDSDITTCVCHWLQYCCSEGWDEECVEAVQVEGCGYCAQLAL